MEMSIWCPVQTLIDSARLADQTVSLAPEKVASSTRNWCVQKISWLLELWAKQKESKYLTKTGSRSQSQHHLQHGHGCHVESMMKVREVCAIDWTAEEMLFRKGVQTLANAINLSLFFWQNFSVPLLEPPPPWFPWRPSMGWDGANFHCCL